MLSTFWLAGLSNGFAQQAQLITATSDANLNTGQTTRKGQFQGLSTTQSLQVVQLGNPLTLQQQGILSLQVPGNSAVQQFRAKYVRIETNSDFTWIGDRVTQYRADGVTMDSTAYATITLLKKSGRMFGEMQIDDLSYQLKDLGQGLTALILMKAPVEGEAYCGTPPGTGTISGRPEGDFPETLCPVRALVLYTQAALDAHSDILDIIDLSIAETNQAFLNSNISEATLKMVLAGTQLLDTTEFIENGESDQPLSLVTNTAINAYRAQYEADLVYVMTDDVYAAFTGAVASFGDTPSDVDSAYAIIAAAHATTPRFSFAHETGHFFGARHELRKTADGSCAGAGDNSGLANAHGFLFTHGKLWWKKDFKTMMAICNGNGTTRLQSYSNPNVKFNGKKTGTEDENFNAKILAFASCRVSHYVDEAAPPPAVAISALDRVCPGGVRGMNAIVSNVPGAITYTWAVSLDGVSYGTPTITSLNSFSVTAPSTNGATFFVRLIVDNGNGVVLTTVKTFFSDAEYCPPGDEHRSTHTIDLLSGTISIYPNPASSILSVRLAGKSDDVVHFQIIDILGKVVREVGNVRADPGLKETEIDISTLSNGVYWLSCDGAAFHHAIRFVCQR